MNMPALMSSMDLPDWVVEHFRERSLDRLDNRHTPERHLEYCHRRNHGSVYIDRDTKQMTAHSLMLDRLSVHLYDDEIPHFYFDDRLSREWYNTSFFNERVHDGSSLREAEIVFRRINFEGQYEYIMQYLQNARAGYHHEGEELDLPF